MQLQLHYTNYITPQLQLHYTYNYNYSCSTPHYIQQLWVRWPTRWPLQPLQPLQKTQLQPPFGPSVDSLCHPWFTTTNLSYRFPIFETSATALCGTTGIKLYLYCVSCNDRLPLQRLALCWSPMSQHALLSCPWRGSNDMPQDEQDRTNSGRLPAESCWRYWPYEQLQSGSNKIPPSYKETKLLRCQKLCVLKVWAWFEGYSERLGLHSFCRREEGENVSSPWTSWTVLSMRCDCMNCEELRSRSLVWWDSMSQVPCKDIAG